MGDVKTLASKNHSITRMTGKEYGRTQGELIVEDLVQEMIGLPTEFSAGVKISLHLYE